MSHVFTEITSLDDTNGKCEKWRNYYKSNPIGMCLNVTHAYVVFRLWLLSRELAAFKATLRRLCIRYTPRNCTKMSFTSFRTHRFPLPQNSGSALHDIRKMYSVNLKSKSGHNLQSRRIHQLALSVNRFVKENSMQMTKKKETDKKNVDDGNKMEHEKEHWSGKT